MYVIYTLLCLHFPACSFRYLVEKMIYTPLIYLSAKIYNFRSVFYFYTPPLRNSSN